MEDLLWPTEKNPCCLYELDGSKYQVELITHESVTPLIDSISNLVVIRNLKISEFKVCTKFDLI